MQTYGTAAPRIGAVAPKGLIGRQMQAKPKVAPKTMPKKAYG